jgi:PAS domain-containing protein
MNRFQEWLFAPHSYSRRITFALCSAILFFLLLTELMILSPLVSSVLLLGFAFLLSCYGGLDTVLYGMGFLWIELGIFSNYHFVQFAFSGFETAFLFSAAFGVSLLGSKIRKNVSLQAHELGQFQDLLADYPGTIIFWRIDAHTFQFLEVNSHSARRRRKGGPRTLLGFPIHHWLNESMFWERHLHPEDRDRVLQVLQRVGQHEGAFDSVEHRFISSTGQDSWFRTFVHSESWEVQFPMDFGKEKLPSILCGVSLDLNQLKAAEAQVRLEANLMEAFLESLEYGILRVDLSGKIISGNRWAEAMLRWSREEMRGQDIQSMVNHSNHVAHLREGLGEASDLAAAIRSGAIYDQPMKMVRPERESSTSLFVWCHTYPLKGAEGQLLGAVISLHASPALKRQLEHEVTERLRDSSLASTSLL